ncbi:MAG: 30S ribosomal protein S4 [Nanoarchaeota archaeon]
MIRKKNRFSWPRKLYDKNRISAENKLVEQYGLKNKREIWKAEAKVKYFRNRAKVLITADPEEQNKFFAKLNSLGLSVKSIADVLALNKEDILRRRLSTIVWKKQLANTTKQARQMIVHRKVAVNGRVVDVPSFLVPISEEATIFVKKPSVIKNNNSEPGQ